MGFNLGVHQQASSTSSVPMAVVVAFAAVVAPRVPNRVMGELTTLGNFLYFAMDDKLRRHISLFHQLPLKC